MSDSSTISEILNGYFGSVFMSKNMVNELPEVKCMIIKDNDHTFTPQVIMKSCRICNKLSELKLHKAPSVDWMVPRILVENSEEQTFIA